MPERIAYGLLFATISAASFSAYFMLQRFHRYAWLPQVVVFLAFGIYYIGVLHEIGADSTIPAGAMALVIACALYSFLTRNAKPRAEYSE